jgi:hypothetical protein
MSIRDFDRFSVILESHEILPVLIIDSALRGTHVLDCDEKEGVADLLVLVVSATP